VSDVIQLLGTAAPWTVIFAGSVVGAFVVFTGITLVAALFHPDEKRAARAMEILKELLRLFRRESR
jgi:hypothetical protein